MSLPARAALIPLVIVGMLLAFLLVRRVQEDRTWQEILERAASGGPASHYCMAPPPDSGLPEDFCFYDRDPHLNEEVEALVTEEARADVRAWLAHVIDHGWSGPVAQVTYSMMEDPEAAWSRDAAERLLDDEAAVLRIYARECVDRLDSSEVTRSSLVRAYRAMLEDLAYPGARYGRKSKEFKLDGFLVSQRKVRLYTTGS